MLSFSSPAIELLRPLPAALPRRGFFGAVCGDCSLAVGFGLSEGAVASVAIEGRFRFPGVGPGVGCSRWSTCEGGTTSLG